LDYTGYTYVFDSLKKEPAHKIHLFMHQARLGSHVSDSLKEESVVSDFELLHNDMFRFACSLI